MTELEQELYVVLVEVMAWISNWSPNFEQDDEWPETQRKAIAAINKCRDEKSNS